MTKPWEKLLGTWKEVPGADEPTTFKIEHEGGGVRISFGCKQGGACTNNITTNYDGNRSKYSDSDWEASFRKTGDRAVQEDAYSSGKLRFTYVWQLSPDGNTLTMTTQPVGPPESKKTTSVYERSGKDVSNNDPFIGSWNRNWNKSDVSMTTFASNGDVLTLTGSDGVSTERNCDGKDHSEAFDTAVLYSCRFNDPHTYELISKKNGKVTFSLIRKISDDGKKMVLIRKNAEGKTMPELTFEKVQ
jgi:hypothetical protein